MSSPRIDRRAFLQLLVGAPALLSLSGCDETASAGRLVAIWGRAGTFPGGLNKPRAMTIDRQDRIYIVDITARIQVFSNTGEFLKGWQTPVHTNGRPTGMSISRSGNLLVADTHYYRVLIYSPDGELLDILGGTNGNGPGEFAWPTDVAEDSQGNLYVSEYGEFDRVQKFSPDHRFLLDWGGHGDGLGQFARPQSIAVDERDRIWVADACNHRLQIFDSSGELVTWWGTQGHGAGELCYPYSFVLAGEDHVYVNEYGNHRVQKFTRDGRSLGCFGTYGRAPGELMNPWAVVRDSRGGMYVLDTGNHRVQCFEL